MTAILSGSSPADCGAVVPVIRKFRTTQHRLYVPLRRPIGGWNARQWRRDVLAWLQAAILVLASWGFCRALEGVIGFVAEVVR